jgi:hypothetical protein
LESRPGKSAKKRKTMRAATVFTGVTVATVGATVGFAGDATANTQVPMPYRLTVYTDKWIVSKEQVCAYKSPYPGYWTCTPIQPVQINYTYGSVSFGNNWRDGKVNVYFWDSGKEYGLTCNTNGAYNGHFKATGGVSLTSHSNAPIGQVTPGYSC